MSQQYPTTFIQQLLKLTHVLGSTAALTTAIALLSTPNALLQQKGLNKVLALSLGLASAVSAKKLVNSWMDVNDIATDLDLVDRRNQISWYSQLTASKPTTVEVKYPQSWVADHMVKDLVQYWASADKHLLIIGGTGDGKSTLIQGLAARLPSWNIRCYDSDATVDDWHGVPPENVIGIGYDLNAIDRAMRDDLHLLIERTQERSQAGNVWHAKPQLIVAEELPNLVSELEVVKDWIPSLAKRGRRVKLFIAAIAQNDTVDNIGLRGDADLRDSCFVRVYLGSKARDRAKKLGNEALLAWLKAQPKGRMLVDDLPCEWFITGTGQVPLSAELVQESTELYLDESQESLEPVQDAADEFIRCSQEGLDYVRNAETLVLTLELYQKLRNAGISRTKIATDFIGGNKAKALQLVNQLESQSNM